MGFLKEYPVDFLLIDMLDTSISEKLLEAPSPDQRPRAIVVMGDLEDLNKECGLVDKLLRKRMKHMGYMDQQWKGY
jgi:hypothetical protein